MSSTRKAIRQYATNLIKSKVDMGDNVFANRPSPRLLDQLPCVCIFWGSETTKIISGSSYRPLEHERTPILYVDIINDDTSTETSTPAESQANEDYLDDKADIIEREFFDDITFSRLLPGFDPDVVTEGLLYGLDLTSTEPYLLDEEGDRRIIATRMSWILPHQKETLKDDKKYKDFLQYHADFIRPGSDKDTVDRALISAEGDV